MPRFSTTVFTAATLASATLLSACDKQPPIRSSAAPKDTVAAQLQPVPEKPLFGAAIIKAHDVLPPAKADTKTPLPAAVPLPSAQAAAPSAGGGSADGGGVNPAAGMAAAVTDSKGAQHDGDGK
ncbi:hypothetical protein ACFIQF_05205 [Comamonas sp. J-3]|jgi:hypothetical protein|uniref:hypothetical protein n=1 Tax=Comamonas trifloxystrobinivorans TaxID=3350256 RepID=UPI00372A5A0D